VHQHLRAYCLSILELQQKTLLRKLNLASRD
jgi:hypothetical protein